MAVVSVGHRSIRIPSSNRLVVQIDTSSQLLNEPTTEPEGKCDSTHTASVGPDSTQLSGCMSNDSFNVVLIDIQAAALAAVARDLNGVGGSANTITKGVSQLELLEDTELPLHESLCVSDSACDTTALEGPCNKQGNESVQEDVCIPWGYLHWTGMEANRATLCVGYHKLEGKSERLDSKLLAVLKLSKRQEENNAAVVPFMWEVCGIISRKLAFTRHPVLDSRNLDSCSPHADPSNGTSSASCATQCYGSDDQQGNTSSLSDRYWYLVPAPHLSKYNETWRLLEIDEELLAEMQSGNHLWFKAHPSTASHSRYDESLSDEECQEIGYSLCLCTSHRTYALSRNSLDGACLLGLQFNQSESSTGIDGQNEVGVQVVPLLGVVRSVLAVTASYPPLVGQIRELAYWPALPEAASNHTNGRGTSAAVSREYIEHQTPSTSQLLLDVQASASEILHFLSNLSLFYCSCDTSQQSLIDNTDNSCPVSSTYCPATGGCVFEARMLRGEYSDPSASCVGRAGYNEVDVKDNAFLYINGTWRYFSLDSWVTAIREINTLAIMGRVDWHSTHPKDVSIAVQQRSLGRDSTSGQCNAPVGGVVCIGVLDQICSALAEGKMAELRKKNNADSCTASKERFSGDWTPNGERICSRDEPWWWTAQNGKQWLLKVGVVYQILKRVGDIWIRPDKRNEATVAPSGATDADGGVHRKRRLFNAGNINDTSGVRQHPVIPWMVPEWIGIQPPATLQQSALIPSTSCDTDCSFVDHFGTWRELLFPPQNPSSKLRPSYVRSFSERFQYYLKLLDGYDVVVDSTGGQTPVHTTTTTDRSCANRLFFRFNLRKVHKALALYVMQYDTVGMTASGYTKPRQRRLKQGIELKVYLEELTRLLKSFQTDLLDVWKTYYMSNGYGNPSSGDSKHINQGVPGCEQHCRPAASRLQSCLIRDFTKGFPNIRDPSNTMFLQVLEDHYFSSDSDSSKAGRYMERAQHADESLSLSTGINMSARIACNVSVLRGCAYFDPKTGCLHHLPDTSLPIRLRERLVMLYTAKDKWFEEELDFYIRPLIPAKPACASSGINEVSALPEESCGGGLTQILVGDPLRHCRTKLINFQFSDGFSENLGVFFRWNLPFPNWTIE
eukprot:GHVQ01040549.1.p1 GENE.GHVQ01040549.1~~GHVQ01040549.1.p1  ORF type:complete len:1127 (+),score=119.47 GHVQ01040549.1:133-3513(+)